MLAWSTHNTLRVQHFLMFNQPSIYLIAYLYLRDNFQVCQYVTKSFELMPKYSLSLTIYMLVVLIIP
jgi:hypothetical protein